MASRDYIDPQGYWVCPESGIRRMGNEDGEQEVIVKKTEACSEAEWKRVCEALMKPTETAHSERALPQFHIDHNRVIIC
jgi:hypothetical protein